MEEQTKIQIVLVSADAKTHQIVLKTFEDSDAEVITLYDCHAFVRESFKYAEDWSIIIIDQFFGSISSIEFINKIRQAYPHLLFIIIKNSKLVDAVVDSALNSERIKYLLHPIEANALKVFINECHPDPKIFKILDSNDAKMAFVKDSDQPIGECPKFISALDIAKRVAPSFASIFLFGESGTGKEIFAKYIHTHSKFKNGPFIAINCSAIPENLFESEFFGHVKGSFTGATSNRAGFFEAAHEGTLFLDEVADLSLNHQAKILRALQDKKIKPVGSSEDILINCRIISATHKNLAKEVLAGQFREDLFFRLNVIPIFLPSLRDRKEDISLLAHIFLHRYVLMNKSDITGFTQKAMDYLNQNKWRGNVRELENAVERAVIMCSKDKIEIKDFIASSSESSDLSIADSTLADTKFDNVFSVYHDDDLPTLETVINEYIAYAVDLNHGAKDKTAKDIGIDRKTQYKRIDKVVS